jgi:hypothetical protein
MVVPPSLANLYSKHVGVNVGVTVGVFVGVNVGVTVGVFVGVIVGVGVSVQDIEQLLPPSVIFEKGKFAS